MNIFRAKTIAVLIVAVFAVTIGATSALGLWRTTTDKIPVTYTTGAVAGEYNPLDIKGSYDFKTISDLFGVPLSVLGTAFSVPEAQQNAFKVKELEGIWADVAPEGVEVGTASVRLFVASYKGLPFALDGTEIIGMPGAAVDLVLQSGQPLPEQVEYLNAHRVDAVPN